MIFDQDTDVDPYVDKDDKASFISNINHSSVTINK
jgi:hypothetical protein